ncbi:transposase [Streptomyces sp. Tue6028]|uniref:transposase n=1 Tax=Streptomyces sp. Tue6028 TaxID=2036037 RepID=UPI003D761ED8
MAAEVRGDYPNESAALSAVAQKLGIGSAETLRNWVRRDELDSGQRPGTTTEESAAMKALKKENAELSIGSATHSGQRCAYLVMELLPGQPLSAALEAGAASRRQRSWSVCGLGQISVPTSPGR